jgi:hypothetical protein
VASVSPQGQRRTVHLSRSEALGERFATSTFKSSAGSRLELETSRIDVIAK